MLIVEDDALVREYVAGQIQSLGYRVLAAGNVREAMTLIDDGENIDLLFTEVVIPGLVNGRQLAIEAISADRCSRCCTPPAMQTARWFNRGASRPACSCSLSRTARSSWRK